MKLAATLCTILAVLAGAATALYPLHWFTTVRPALERAYDLCRFGRGTFCVEPSNTMAVAATASLLAACVTFAALALLLNAMIRTEERLGTISEWVLERKWKERQAAPPAPPAPVPTVAEREAERLASEQRRQEAIRARWDPNRLDPRIPPDWRR